VAITCAFLNFDSNVVGESGLRRAIGTLSLFARNHHRAKIRLSNHHVDAQCFGR